MKNLVALHAAQDGKPARPFTHSMVQKLLTLHGEKVSTSFKTGDFYVHNSDTETWSRTNDTTGMQIIRLFDVKEFLMKWGNKRPIPESEWQSINEEINNDKFGYEKPLGVGEWLESAVS